MGPAFVLLNGYRRRAFVPCVPPVALLSKALTALFVASAPFAACLMWVVAQRMGRDWRSPFHGKYVQFINLVRGTSYVEPP